MANSMNKGRLPKLTFASVLLADLLYLIFYRHGF